MFGNVKTFTLLTQTWSTATSDLSFKELPPYRYGLALLAIGFEPRRLLQGSGQPQCAMGKCLNREVVALENNTVRALICCRVSYACDGMSSRKKVLSYFSVLFHMCSVMLKRRKMEDTNLDEAINSRG